VDVDDDCLVKVGSATPPQAVASSIVKLLLDRATYPVVRAVGAGAVNQACKGIAIARSQIALKGIDLGCGIGFDSIRGDQGQEISAQVFHLYKR
jgi:stage V sporulation protein S